jgi:glycosyltransferase involved in cell wall biosynthesis
MISTNPDGIEVIEQYVEDVELPALLSRSHMMLMPYTEFFSQSGVANLALGNGRALVATDVGGLSEIVAHSECAIRISSPTVSAVKEALLKAIADGHDGLRAKGVEARRLAVSKYSWAAIGKKHKALYEDLISRL